MPGGVHTPLGTIWRIAAQMLNQPDRRLTLSIIGPSRQEDDLSPFGQRVEGRATRAICFGPCAQRLGHQPPCSGLCSGVGHDLGDGDLVLASLCTAAAARALRPDVRRGLIKRALPLKDHRPSAHQPPRGHRLPTRGRGHWAGVPAELGAVEASLHGRGVGLQGCHDLSSFLTGMRIRRGSRRGADAQGHRRAPLLPWAANSNAPTLLRRCRPKGSTLGARRSP